jgi:hypothetical protein
LTFDFLIPIKVLCSGKSGSEVPLFLFFVAKNTGKVILALNNVKGTLGDTDLVRDLWLLWWPAAMLHNDRAPFG